LCTCGGPLLARYDLERIRRSWTREDLASAPNSMWPYSPALPVAASESIVSLGEGMTPLLPVHRTGKRIGAADLWIKDEGLIQRDRLRHEGCPAPSPCASNWS
jgi:threonine synthase